MRSATLLEFHRLRPGSAQTRDEGINALATFGTPAARAMMEWRMPEAFLLETLENMYFESRNCNAKESGASTHGALGTPAAELANSPQVIVWRLRLTSL